MPDTKTERTEDQPEVVVYDITTDETRVVDPAKAEEWAKIKAAMAHHQAKDVDA